MKRSQSSTLTALTAVLASVLVSACSGGGPAGPALTIAQAMGVEKTFDTADDQAHGTGDASGLAAVETCSTIRTDSARTTADKTIGFVGAQATPVTSTTSTAIVIPGAGSFPQQFLSVEHYVAPSVSFDAQSLNVFTRQSAKSPWQLCDYPNLFSGQPVPTFATSATGVLRSPVGTSLATKAGHALDLLAGWMTQRASKEVPTPAGLDVPFGRCAESEPECNPDGAWDPYRTSVEGVSDPLHVSRNSDPVFVYPTTDGGALVIADLTMVEHEVASASNPLVQDDKRSQLDIVVPPGSYSSIRADDVFQVALKLSANGDAREVGQAWDSVSATETPVAGPSPSGAGTNA